MFLFSFDICMMLGICRRTLDRHTAAGIFSAPDSMIGGTRCWKASSLEKQLGIISWYEVFKNRAKRKKKKGRCQSKI